MVGISSAAAMALGQIPDDSPVREALQRAESDVAKIVQVSAGKRDFDNTIGQLDDLVTRLMQDTSFVQFMAYVSTDAEERERGSRAEADVSNWMLGLMKREDLYEAFKAYSDTKPALEGERRKIFDDLAREFRRAGMALSREERERLKGIQEQIIKLGIEFDQAIRDDETRVMLTRDELPGMPDDFFEDLPRVGDVYLLGMDYPTFIPVQEYCDNETTRQKLWLAFKRRAGTANVRRLEQILQLRAQAAQILGYQHAADFEIEPRMAHTAQNVMDFYNQVRPLVREKARRDLKEFTEAKREHVGDARAQLFPWDYSFYEKLLLKTRYAVDSQKVAEYFPLERVIDGLFSITQSLYGLEYRDVTAEAASRGLPLWHPDVRLFEVLDKQTGDEIGMFYIDLFPRENKYNHAAQWGLRDHKIWLDGNVSKPLAALVCNFPKPTADKPSLLPHKDVETFFHEFGHCLHTILSKTHYGMVAGTSTARDFVEAPSQMFENWVWDAEVLGSFSAHYQTGEPLPPELIEGMIAARNLGSGMAAERQFYYGLVDMAYHTAPDGKVNTTEVANSLFPQIELFAFVPEVHFQASFGHLVGYQAGYYGYMWSKVYAADMFQRFKELGMLNPEAGQYYREKILSRGGSMDEMDMVRDYLGREPRMEAFLEALGLEPGE